MLINLGKPSSIKVNVKIKRKEKINVHLLNACSINFPKPQETGIINSC